MTHALAASEDAAHKPLQTVFAVAYALAAAVLLASPLAARAADATHGAMAADKMTWGLMDPKQPNGIQLAVLYGDPSKSGPFGLRLKIPAGLQIGSHSHSSSEYITVVSGKATMVLPATVRRTPLVTDLHTFAADFWPVEETADDINTYLAQQRAADRLLDLPDRA